MFDRRYAYFSSMLYAAAIAATLIVNAKTAFLVVIVVGGPVIGMMYWGSSDRQPRE